MIGAAGPATHSRQSEPIGLFPNFSRHMLSIKRSGSVDDFIGGKFSLTTLAAHCATNSRARKQRKGSVAGIACRTGTGQWLGYIVSNG